MRKTFAQADHLDTGNSRSDAGRSRARKRTKSKQPDSALRSYMQLMGNCPTFSAEQEQAAAVALHEARCDRWAALLRYPPLVASIRERLTHALTPSEELEAILTELEQSGEEFRQRRTLANEAEFHEQCKRLGTMLPELDTDSELAEQIIADVERIAVGEREGLGLEVARMPGDSRPFRVYLRGCRKTHARVRKLSSDFAKANLRLVVSLAHRLARGRLPLADLIQEGNIGLLKAVERFDHRRGFRFSTYASWWIRHSISRAIYNKGRQVRLPVHVHDVHQKITKTRRLFLARVGREPSLDELVEETGLPRVKVEKISQIELGPVLSLDAPSSRGDDRSAVDLLEDEATPDPGWGLEVGELEDGLEDALSCLRPMEADIVRRRYGLYGTKPETLREIGERYALSRERIRQLQERAVMRIRDEFSRMQLL